MRFAKKIITFLGLISFLGLITPFALGADISKPPDTFQIVFDVRGSLVQEIPSYNLSKLDRSQIITVNGKHYRIANDVRKLLARLRADPKVSVSFIDSSLSPAESKEIVGTVLDISKPAIPEKELGRFGLSKDLGSWGLDPSNTMVVLAKDSKETVIGQVARFAPIYFHYDSFSQVQENLEELKKNHAEAYKRKKDSFPADKQEWKRHQERAQAIYGLIQGTLSQVSTGQSLSQSLSNEVAKPFDTHMERGVSLLNRDVIWKVVDNQVTGCSEKDPQSGTETQVSVEICKNILGTQLKWDETKTPPCSNYTAQNQLISVVPATECLHLFNPYYLWISAESQKCGIFTETLKLVQETERSKCRFNVECNVETGILRSFLRNPGNQYLFQALPDLKKYLSGEGDSLNRKSSYARLLLENGLAPTIKKQLGEKCSEALAKHYRSGATLYSEVFQKSVKPVNRWSYASGVADAKFYHWGTRSDFRMLNLQMGDRKDAHEKTLREGGYDDVLKFYRSPSKDQGFWYSVWYAAEDPTSSSGYGTEVLEIEFKPEAKVIHYLTNVWKEALEDLKARYPDLAESCNIRSSQAPSDCNNFSVMPPLFMILEDSGIDIISYKGCGATESDQYFQILNVKNIQSVK